MSRKNFRINRRDFQGLARVRLREARALLRAKCWDGAYYLAGYAVECALKACLAKKTRRHDFPNKDFVNNSYKHDLEELLKLADLHKLLEAAGPAGSNLGANWGMVKSWDEVSRYEQHSETKARELVAAVGHSKHGVLAWIRQHW